MSEPGPESETELVRLFADADDGFLTHLCDVHDREQLIPLAELWVSDARPWAQSQLQDYLDGSLALPGHEVVFKRVMRHVEAARDHAKMATLLVELDRCVRRCRVSRLVLNDGQLIAQDVPYARPNRCRPPQPPRVRQGRHPATGRPIRWISPPYQAAAEDRLFTQTTRAYLRRRAWRYLRELSRTDPDAYVSAAGTALQIYQDADFASKDNIVDNRSLMHIAFFDSPVLSFGATHVDIAPEASVNDLRPAAWMPDVWKTVHGFQTLMTLTTKSDSRFIRQWAIQLLESIHADSLRSVAPDSLLRLASHDDALVQDFAANLLEQHESVDQFSPDQWAELCDQPTPSVRQSAFAWLETECAGDERGAWINQPKFWLRLLESPRNDVRINSVRVLRRSFPIRLSPDFAPILHVIANDPQIGSRNRCWALMEWTGFVLAGTESPNALAHFLGEAVKSPKNQERRTALSSIARISEVVPSFRNAIPHVSQVSDVL